MRGAGCSQGTGWESHLGKVMEGLCKAKAYSPKEDRVEKPKDQIPWSSEKTEGT